MVSFHNTIDHWENRFVYEDVQNAVELTKNNPYVGS